MNLEAALPQEQVPLALVGSAAKSSLAIQQLESTANRPSPFFKKDLTASDPDTAYYAEQDHRWNAKAIAALPVAVATVVAGIALQSILLLLIGGAVAFTLGLIGSRQCRDREDRGKGFAIAGMALGAAALFFSLMVLIWAA